MTGKSKERPGVMLYFDAVRPVISRLDETQCGVLLRSIMDYAQYGVVPELDSMTGLAFDMLVPKIDRDAERYEESREQRQYAVYTREKKRSGEPVMSIGEWRLFRQREDEKNIGPIRPDIGPLHLHLHPQPQRHPHPHLHPHLHQHLYLHPQPQRERDARGRGRPTRCMSSGFVRWTPGTTSGQWSSTAGSSLSVIRRT